MTDEEPLSARDYAMIDQAWENHKAALPVATVINDNQPGRTAIIEITIDPATLPVGTKLYAGPKMVELQPEAEYLVWSNEHRAWWGPNHRGYNTHLSHAGRYTRDEALAICVGARGGREFNRNPSETPVLMKDAEKFWADDDLQKQHRREAREREEEARHEEEAALLRDSNASSETGGR